MSNSSGSLASRSRRSNLEEVQLQATRLLTAVGVYLWNIINFRNLPVLDWVLKSSNLSGKHYFRKFCPGFLWADGLQGMEAAFFSEQLFRRDIPGTRLYASRCGTLEYIIRNLTWWASEVDLKRLSAAGAVFPADEECKGFTLWDNGRPALINSLSMTWKLMRTLAFLLYKYWLIKM